MYSHIKKMALLYVIAIFFISLDRFAKMYFFQNFTKVVPINHFLSLQYAENPYISFSLPMPISFIKYATLLLGIILVFVFIKFYKKNNTLLNFSLFSLILGSFSNIVDRFKYGFVIDYINLKFFTIFNIADSLIFISIILLSYHIYTIDKKKKKGYTKQMIK